MNLFRYLLVLVFCPMLLKAQNADVDLPLSSLKVTSGFGYRIHPVLQKESFHHGVDLSAKHDNVYSVMDGLVENCGYDLVLGNYILINHGGFISQYGHLSISFVRNGQQVRAGGIIGVTGQTGRVTGEHLHFSIFYNHQPVDPLLFMAKLFLGSKTFNN